MNLCEDELISVTATGHNQAELDAARMAEFVFSPVTDDAKRFVAHLTNLTLQHEASKSLRKRARQPQAARSFEQAVGAFSADLLHHGGNDLAGGFMYRSSDKDAMGLTLVSVRSFEQLTEWWKEMDLIEATSFFRAKGTWEEHEIGAYLGRARRYRATEALLELAASFGIGSSNVKRHFEKQMGRLSPVLVRGERIAQHGKKAQPVAVKKSGPRYEFEVSRISEVNKFLGSGGFDLKEAPWLCRMFQRGEGKSFDFDQGGRLYCRSEHNWQEMAPKQRLEITWNGEPTVEIDVKASHMFILYALHPSYAIPVGDLYSISDIEREVVKGLITAFLGNGAAPRRWPKEMGRKFFERTGRKISRDYTLSTVISAIESKHPILREVEEHSMDWGKLQYLESECFVEALLELGRSYGIAALPVHDSLIVAKRHAEVTKRVLLEAYERQFGQKPEVRVTEGKGLPS